MKENLPINIVEEIWIYLSPFSAHQIEIWGEKFSTVEHAYQWAKFLPGKVRDEIKNSKSPKEAWRIAQMYKNDSILIDSNFDKDEVMEELFREKVKQHKDVEDVLRATTDRGILKIHKDDYYWGTGADGSGQNKMGKLWMKIRSEVV